MEEALLVLVRNLSEFTAIVPADRVSWGFQSQGLVLPICILTNVSSSEGVHMNGVNSVQEHRVQIDVFTEDYRSAKLATRALRVGLNGYRGGPFRLIEDAGVRDLGFSDHAVEQKRAYQISNDFIIHWRET